MRFNRLSAAITVILLIVFAGSIAFSIGRRGAVTGIFGATADAKSRYSRPYPMPNQFWKKNEEFYVFASGGQQGGLYIYGIPSMKYLSEVPIFNESVAWGWTTEDTKVRQMLTNPWTGELKNRGDTHHPSLSMTKGEYDGRWLFIGDKLNPRVARVDLDVFRAGQVLWIPNFSGGLHGTSLSPDSDLYVANFEHEQAPDPAITKQLGLEVDPVKGPYVSGFAGVRVGKDGEMSNAWQVWGPYQYDLLRVGKGKADGWIINTSYNTERATNTLGMFKKDTDYVFFWNRASIEKAIAEEKYTTTKQAPDVPVISWKDVEVYAVPIPLNPHGVDLSPTGKYVVTAGKATSYVTAIDFEKVLADIKAGKYTKDEYGFRILDPKSVYAANMDVGLGATHIEFDNKGSMYVGFFVDSDIKRIPLGGDYVKLHNEEPWKVAEVIPAHYSVGHLLIPGGDTVKPYGKYLISMNKLAKDTFIPQGPLVTENHELFTIGDGPAKLVDQMPLGPETHYSQAVPVSLIAPKVKAVYEIPAKVEKPRVEYDYAKKEVRVYMDVVRSFYTPNSINVPQGWRVKFRLASQEEARDITHGFAIEGYNVSVSVDPGEVREVEFVANQPGLFWFYCNWFCSELHMEMRGKMVVVPESQWSKSLEIR